MIQVGSPFENRILFIVLKKWFENPGRDNLVSERSFEYLGLWGDFRLNGLHYFFLLSVVVLAIHV